MKFSYIFFLSYQSHLKERSSLIIIVLLFGHIAFWDAHQHEEVNLQMNEKSNDSIIIYYYSPSIPQSCT